MTNEISPPPSAERGTMEQSSEFYIGYNISLVESVVAFRPPFSEEN